MSLLTKFILTLYPAVVVWWASVGIGLAINHELYWLNAMFAAFLTSALTLMLYVRELRTLTR